MNKYDKTMEQSLPLLLSLFGLACLALPCVLVLFHFPVNYGWQQAYLYFQDTGLEMYKSFNSPFPPLFTTVTEISNTDEFYIRHSLLAGFLRLSLFYASLILIGFVITKGKVQSSLIILGAFLIAIMQVRTTVFVIDDYHIFERTITAFVIGLFAYVCFNTVSERVALSIFSATAFLSVALLFSKQNVGLLVSLALVAALFRDVVRGHYRGRILIAFLACWVVSGAFFIGVYGIDLTTAMELTFGNDAKGELRIIATNLIAAPPNSYFFQVSCLLAGVLLIAQLFFPELKKPKFFKPTLVNSLRQMLSDYGLFFTLPVVVYSIVRLENTLFPIVALTLVIVGVVNSIFSRARWYSISILGAALIYANSMTSGLVPETIAFIVVPTVLFALHKSVFADKSKNIAFVFTLFCVGLVSVNTFSRKAESPYTWWGYAQEPWGNAVHRAPYPEMEGLRISSSNLLLLERIKTFIDEFSQQKDDLYLYPYLPFFYLLHDKIPPTKNPVQWFDVINDNEMANELRFIKEQPPRTVLMFDPPISVYEGHENFKNNDLQRQFALEMDRKLMDGEASLEEYLIYSPHGDNFKVDLQLVVSNQDAIGQSLSNINARVHELTKDYNAQLNLKKADGSNKDDKLLDRGDILFGAIPKDVAEQLVVQLGYVPLKHQSWYALKGIVIE